MKRLLPATAVALCLGFLVSGCMTTYDAQGRPVQSVDPGAAVMAAAAAGVVGYALGSDGDHHHHYRYRPHPTHAHYHHHAYRRHQRGPRVPPGHRPRRY